MTETEPLASALCDRIRDVLYASRDARAMMDSASKVAGEECSAIIAAILADPETVEAVARGIRESQDVAYGTSNYETDAAAAIAVIAARIGVAS